MPIFILVRQLVLLVCINSALIMSPPAQTINKTPLKRAGTERAMSSIIKSGQKNTEASIT